MEPSLGGISDLSTSCCGQVESSEVLGRRSSLYSQQLFPTGSSCSPLNWTDQVCGRLSTVHSFEEDSDSDCHSSLGKYSLALAGLRDNVSQGDPCYAGPFFKDVEREVRQEEDEPSAADSVINEGIIFYNEVRLFYFIYSLLVKMWFCKLSCFFFLLENRTSRLWIQGREGVHTLKVYQRRLLWWSTQCSRCQHRLQVCCQKGTAEHIDLFLFPTD